MPDPAGGRAAGAKAVPDVPSETTESPVRCPDRVQPSASPAATGFGMAETGLPCDCWFANHLDWLRYLGIVAD